MTAPTLSLSFSIGPDDPLGTLENVLAIARRGGLALANMHVRNGSAGLHAGLLLTAPDRDRLDLFAHRLRNLYEISNVNCQEDVSGIFTPQGNDQLAHALSV